MIKVRQLTREDLGSMSPDEYLGAGEVAIIFHVSAKTVSRWADKGLLPHMVTLGGQRRFRVRAVIEAHDTIFAVGSVRFK